MEGLGGVGLLERGSPETIGLGVVGVFSITMEDFYREAEFALSDDRAEVIMAENSKQVLENGEVERAQRAAMQHVADCLSHNHGPQELGPTGDEHDHNHSGHDVGEGHEDKEEKKKKKEKDRPKRVAWFLVGLSRN